jgi:hypothetical protein
MRCSAVGFVTTWGDASRSSNERLVLVPIDGAPPIIMRIQLAPPMAIDPMPVVVTASIP